MKSKRKKEKVKDYTVDELSVMARKKGLVFLPLLLNDDTLKRLAVQALLHRCPKFTPKRRK